MKLGIWAHRGVKDPETPLNSAQGAETRLPRGCSKCYWVFHAHHRDPMCDNMVYADAQPTRLLFQSYGVSRNTETLIRPDLILGVIVNTHGELSASIWVCCGKNLHDPGHQRAVWTCVQHRGENNQQQEEQTDRGECGHAHIPSWESQALYRYRGRGSGGIGADGWIN